MTRTLRSSASKPRASGSRPRPSMPPRSPAAGPACCMATAPICLMDDDGQIIEGHSISAGLDYPGIGPEHAWLHDMKRVQYVSATDKEALAAFQLCCKLEGIIPALEPSHALAHVHEDRAEEAQGPSDGDEHVRPRRQGHLHGGRYSGSEAVTTRIDRRFAALKARRPRRARHLRDGGRSRL